MAETRFSLLSRRRDELVPLRATHGSWTHIRAWHSLTKTLISTKFPEHLQQFDDLMPKRWAMELPGDQGQALTKNNEIAADAKQRLLSFMDGILSLATLEVDPSNIAQLEASVSGTSTCSRKVFVVHGHDLEMQQAVALLVTRLGLEPIILSEHPNAGQTLIEKLERHADVGFAIVLLSPDDMSYKSGESPKSAAPRARQNVILELGYFYGRLKRHRVVALRRKELEDPSDISGVAYTAYDSTGVWRYELVRELQFAGYDVDANVLTRKTPTEIH